MARGHTVVYNVECCLRGERSMTHTFQRLNALATRVYPISRARMASRIRMLFSIWLLAQSAACNEPAPAVVDTPVPQSAIVPERIEYSDWSLTLSRGVRGNEIDVANYVADFKPLDAFLNQAAAIGPKKTPALFPDVNTHLAFLINLQNAVVLRDLTYGHRIRPKSLDANPRAGSCVFDGRRWTIGELQNEIWRVSNDDWRVPFALFDGRRDGPPLWPKPILPEGLDAQLTRIAQSALTQPQIVFIDHERLRLRLWPGLYDNRSRLIAQYEQRYHTTDGTVLSALLDLSDADRRAELNTAIGYPVDRLPSNPEAAIVQHGTVLK